jgi:hypothetical protein
MALLYIEKEYRKNDTKNERSHVVIEILGKIHDVSLGGVMKLFMKLFCDNQGSTKNFTIITYMHEKVLSKKVEIRSIFCNK